MGTENKMKTGEVNFPKVICPTHGFGCAIYKLQELRCDFLDKIVKLDKLNAVEGKRLEMAQFVKSVAESVADVNEGELNAEEAWSRLTPKKGSGKDTSGGYDDTQLSKEIKELTKKIEDGKKQLESSGEKLVEYLRDQEVQQHIVDVHSNQYISPETAITIYDLHEDAASKRIRLIDHLIAEVTDAITTVKAGREFIAELFSDNELKKHPAFSDVWGHIGKIKNAYDTGDKVLAGGLGDISDEFEAINRFFFNVSSHITSKISKKIADGAVDSILELSDDADLKPIFKFLDKKYGAKILDMLLDRGEKFCQMGDKAIDVLNKGNSIKKSFKGLTKEIGDLKPDDLGKYDAKAVGGAWFSLAMDMVSFSLAVVSFKEKFKKKEANLKDWIDLFQNAAGAVKTGVEIVEAYSKALATNSDDLLFKGMSVSSPSNMAKVVKGVGVVAGLLTAAVATMNAYEGAQKNDKEILFFNAASAGLALGGVAALIIGATSVTVVLAIVGVLLTIIMMLVLDPPILNYLELTVWSKQKPGHIKLDDTINGFYKELGYSISISFHVNEQLKNYSYFLIESKGLSDDSRVYVNLEVTSPKVKKDEERLQQLSFMPKRAKGIDSSGIPKMAKSSFWHDSRYDKSLKIFEIKNTWGNLSKLMQEGNKFTVHAGIDPMNIAAGKIPKMSINTKVEDLELDLFQEPVLWGKHSNKFILFSTPRSGRTTRIELESNNELPVCACTKYARNHSVQIHIKDGLPGTSGDYWSKPQLIDTDDEKVHTLNVAIDKYWGTETDAEVVVELLYKNKIVKTESYGVWTFVKNGHM